MNSYYSEATKRGMENLIYTWRNHNSYDGVYDSDDIFGSICTINAHS